MRNLLLTIRYCGTRYSGWQVQTNAPTVQQTLQDAIENLFQTRENVTGCSRTDSGVHANRYCCNIRTASPLPCQTVVSGLNAYLPDDIAVLSCQEVDYEFHARYDCTGKEYLYILRNSAVRDPFLIDRCWLFKPKLDEKLMQAQAQAFVGEHDFSAFCAAGASTVNNVRTVRSFTVERIEDEIRFRVTADGFLYNMVRIMVGTLVSISLGKIPPDTLPQIIGSRDRERAGVTAPPQGLYLNRVFYEGNAGGIRVSGKESQ